MADEEQYLDFSPVPHGTKHEDGTPVLNRYSTNLTRGHDFPGAQVCLKYYLNEYPAYPDVVTVFRPCFMLPACQIER